jgi:hypothetical protein
VLLRRIRFPQPAAREIELGRQLAKLVIQLRVSNATPPHGVLCGRHARKNRGDARIGRPPPVHSQERPRRLALDQFSHIAVHVADLHNEIVPGCPIPSTGGGPPGCDLGVLQLFRTSAELLG